MTTPPTRPAMVTDAMRKAGRQAYMNGLIEKLSVSDTVSAIYLAMHQAATVDHATVERVRRFAVDDEHWQLVWSNAAEMKTDIASLLGSRKA